MQGICPYCQVQFSIPDQSKAHRPRKHCPKCHKKSELKFWKNWKKKDPSPQKNEKVPVSLTSEENLILEEITSGLFASTISRKHNFSQVKVHRIIQKLIKLNIIEPVRSYPKIYIIKTPQDQKDLPRNSPEKWPSSTTIHCLRFKVPMKVMGNIGGSRSFQMEGWTKRLFSYVDHPELHEWKIEINTKCVVFDYTPKIRDASNAQSAIADLQKRLPLDFLQKKGFILDDQHITLVQSPHCELKFNSPIDALGAHQPIKILNPDGTERFHADNSDGSNADGIETTIQQADKILDVHDQIKILQEQVSRLTQVMTAVTQQFSQILSAILPQPQTQSQSPQPVEYFT